MTAAQSSLATEESTFPSPAVDDEGRSAAARPAFRRFLFVAKIIRDAWLILGITIAIAVIAESAYRVQGVLRRFIAGQPPIEAMHPYHRYGWFPEYHRE